MSGREVQFVCTDGGSHPNRHLGRYRLTTDGVERCGGELSTVSESLALQCPKCPRDVRLTPETLRRLVEGIVTSFPDDSPVIRFDLSRRSR